METAPEPLLEVTISPRKMPRRTRNGILVALGGALAGAIAAMTWLIPPVSLFSALIWAAFVGVAAILVGLYASGFLVRTTLRIDRDGIRAQQWRFTKELPFTTLRRIYLFHDRSRETLALVPHEGEVWYLGLGLSPTEVDAVGSCLSTIAHERGIEFRRDVTFAEILECEMQEPRDQHR